MELLPFDIIPNEIICQITLILPLKDIINLCRTNKTLYLILYNNDYFWKQKFKLEYSDIKFDYHDWKTLYINFNNVYVSGKKLIDDGKFICGGCSTVYILDNNNNIWTKQMYDNSTNITQYNMRKNNFVKAKKIISGWFTMAVIDMNNNLWICVDETVKQHSIGSIKQICNVNIDGLHMFHLDNIKAKQICLGGDINGFAAIIDDNDNVRILGDISTANERTTYGINITNETKCPILPNIKAQQISCGYTYISIIDKDNNVLSFGDNKYGQLGLGPNLVQNQNFIPIPTIIPNLKAKLLSIGTSHHTMVVDLYNNIWAYGNNTNGQLGLGDTTNRNIPTKVETFYDTSQSIFIHMSYIKPRQIYVSGCYTMILDENYDIWKCGNISRKNVEWSSNIFIKQNGIKAKEIYCNPKIDAFIGHKSV